MALKIIRNSYIFQSFKFSCSILKPISRRRLSLCKVSNYIVKNPLIYFDSSKFRTCTTNCTTDIIHFETGNITQYAITNEIQFYRDTTNNFSQICFSDEKEAYGPPLAVLFPFKTLGNCVLKKFIHTYGEKGFDIVTVSVSGEQLLYPCVSGGAMNVVSDLLLYLSETHRHRPYIFHGFSVGVYLYGEMMAQFFDHYELYKYITNNIKGCLWDSPVDFETVKHCAGRHCFPNNWYKRWRCNARVRKHLKNHQHDSVEYWTRARNNFCSPISKVPNVFFVSCSDVLSNPDSLQCVQNILECNGVPIFQKSWVNSKHAFHFEKYCYEYLYGMELFFNLCNLFPDECGKYKCSDANASLINLKLRKKAKDILIPKP